VSGRRPTAQPVVSRSTASLSSSTATPASLTVLLPNTVTPTPRPATLARAVAPLATVLLLTTASPVVRASTIQLLALVLLVVGSGGMLPTVFASTVPASVRSAPQQLCAPNANRFWVSLITLTTPAVWSTVQLVSTQIVQHPLASTALPPVLHAPDRRLTVSPA
jgi:hypothetical protein